MESAEPGRETPLAQVQELRELKRRYRIYNDETLRRWMTAVMGPPPKPLVVILRVGGAGA